MNNSRRHRRGINRRAAIASAEFAGCVCRPDVRLGHDDPSGIQHLFLAHDADCPLSAGGTTVAIVDDGKGCG